jgi:predicted AAA+ superfamily ATPase
MSVREVRGRASQVPFIDRVTDGGPDAVTAPEDALSVRDYLDLMLAGKFPEPSLRMPATARRRWFAGYVEQMITRDVPAVAPRRHPGLLRRYLSVLAVNTAGIAAESTLWSAAGINAKTAQAYQALFQRMFVLDLVPAWFSNPIKRLVKAPKRYLVDPALVTAVLGLGSDAILYGPDMLGRLLDTFIAAQLHAELGSGHRRGTAVAGEVQPAATGAGTAARRLVPVRPGQPEDHRDEAGSAHRGRLARR